MLWREDVAEGESSCALVSKAMLVIHHIVYHIVTAILTGNPAKFRTTLTDPLPHDDDSAESLIVPFIALDLSVS